MLGFGPCLLPRLRARCRAVVAHSGAKSFNFGIQMPRYLSDQLRSFKQWMRDSKLSDSTASVYGSLVSRFWKQYEPHVVAGKLTVRHLEDWAESLPSSSRLGFIAAWSRFRVFWQETERRQLPELTKNSLPYAAITYFYDQLGPNTLSRLRWGNITINEDYVSIGLPKSDLGPSKHVNLPLAIAEPHADALLHWNFGEKAQLAPLDAPFLPRAPFASEPMPSKQIAFHIRRVEEIRDNGAGGDLTSMEHLAIVFDRGDISREEFLAYLDLLSERWPHLDISETLEELLKAEKRAEKRAEKDKKPAEPPPDAPEFTTRPKKPQAAIDALGLAGQIAEKTSESAEEKARQIKSFADKQQRAEEERAAKIYEISQEE